MDSQERSIKEPDGVRSFVIVFSYHHHNTEKIDRVIAGVPGAVVKTPQEIQPEKLRDYDLIAFRSGIYGATFGPQLKRDQGACRSRTIREIPPSSPAKNRTPPTANVS